MTANPKGPAVTNTMHEFVTTAGGMDANRGAIAAMLVLGDRIAGRPARPLSEYHNLAVLAERKYGHGLAAATLLAAGWLDDPAYT